MIDWVTTRWRQWAAAVRVELSPPRRGGPSAGSSRRSCRPRASTPASPAGRRRRAWRCGRTRHVVRLEVGPPAEGAAGEQGLDLDRAGQRADDHGGVELVQGRDLRAEGQLGLPPPISATQFIGSMVRGRGTGSRSSPRDLAAARGRGAAPWSRTPATSRRPAGPAGGQGVVAGEHGVGSARLGLVVVPLDLQRVAPLARGPGVLRRPRRRRSGSGTRRRRRGPCGPPWRRSSSALPPKRGMGDHGGQHVRQVDVLGEARGAGRLGDGVLAAHPVGADQGEVRGRLQRGRLGRLDLGRVGQQFGEARRRAGGVRDDAVLDRDLRPGRERAAAA
jgi:hypothetical protein